MNEQTLRTCVPDDTKTGPADGYVRLEGRAYLDSDHSVTRHLSIDVPSDHPAHKEMLNTPLHLSLDPKRPRLLPDYDERRRAFTRPSLSTHSYLRRKVVDGDLFDDTSEEYRAVQHQAADSMSKEMEANLRRFLLIQDETLQRENVRLYTSARNDTLATPSGPSWPLITGTLTPITHKDGYMNTQTLKRVPADVRSTVDIAVDENVHDGLVMDPDGVTVPVEDFVERTREHMRSRLDRLQQQAHDNTSKRREDRKRARQNRKTGRR